MAWLAGYSKRKAITVTGGASGAQTDFQIKLTVTYDGDMQSDFDDLRFTQADGTTLIDAWLETKTDDASATVWAEFPTTPANTVEQTYYMYYGKVVGNYWDGAATFQFFDDFTGDLSKWNITGTVSIVSEQARITGNDTWDGNGMTTVDTFSKPIVLEYGVQQLSSLYAMNGFSVQPLDINKGIFWNMHTNGNFYYRVDSVTTSSGTYTAGSVDDVKWILPSGNGFKLYRNGILRREDTAWTNPNAANRLSFIQYSSGQYLFVDYARIRKYATGPPTYAFGAEESAPTGAAPMGVFTGCFGRPLGGII